MKCPKCSAEVAAGNKFCPECGAKMVRMVRVGGLLGKFKTGAKKVWSYLFGEKTTEEKAVKKEAEKKQ